MTSINAAVPTTVTLQSAEAWRGSTGKAERGGDKGLPKGHSHSLTLCSLQLSSPQSILLGKWREGALGKMIFKARQVPSLEEEARLEQHLLFPCTCREKPICKERYQG